MEAKTGNPPENPTPNPNPQPPIDPLVKSISEAIGLAIEPEKVLDQKPNPQPEPQTPSGSISEMMIEAKRKEDAEKAAAEAKQKDAESKPDEQKTAQPPDEKPAIKVAFKPVPTDAAPPVNPQPVAPEPKDQSRNEPGREDKEFLEKLTDEEREQFELAEFAERINPEKYKGKANETKQFFTKMAEFLEKNKEVSPDDDEFKTFVEENKPKWKPGELRRVEKDFIAAQVEERIKKTELAKMREDMHAATVKPLIEREVSEFNNKLLAEKPDMPEGLNPLEPEIAEAAKKFIASPTEDGYKEFTKSAPVEAPIIASTIASVSEFHRITNGVAQFDPSNPRHAWLDHFISTEGARYEAMPKDQTTVNGKQFLPRTKYAEVAATKPADLSKYWTFSNQQIVDMLRINAHMAVQARYSELETAGFTRTKKASAAKAETNATPPSQKQAEASPKATPPKMVDNTSKSLVMSPTDKLLETLIPGGASMAKL